MSTNSPLSRSISTAARRATPWAVMGLMLVTACEANKGGETASAGKDTAAQDHKGGDKHAADSDADSHAGHKMAAASQPAGKKTELGKGESPATREEADADGVIRRGSKLPEGDAVAVSVVFEKAKELDGKPVLVSGQVAKVCKKKGCWWSITDDKDTSKKIRITHKDYGFFVPSKAEGKKARAFGVVNVKEMSQEEAEHMAKDEGKKLDDKAKAALPKVEVRLVASALEMRS